MAISQGMLLKLQQKLSPMQIQLVKLLEMQQKKAARTKKEDAECGR